MTIVGYVTSNATEERILIPAPVSESSDDLKIAMTSFMATMVDVLEHPLSLTNPKFRVILEADQTTGAVKVADLDMLNADKSSWAYLATLVRPLVYSQNEPTYVPKLVNKASRDHSNLRAALQPVHAMFKEWKNDLIMRVDTMPPGYASTGGVKIGPPGVVSTPYPGSVSATAAELTDVVLNGCLWHSDSEKAKTFHDGSPMSKQIAMKCAEVRTIMATPTLALLHQFVSVARSGGYDF